MRLRDYQQEAVNSVFQYFYDNKVGNPVIASPTGTGKSLIIAGLVKEILTNYSNQKILVLTHVKELIEQNHDKLLTYWPTAPAGIHSAGLNKRDYYNKVIFGGIGSIYKNADRFGHVDLIIIDECHLLSNSENSMYQVAIVKLAAINPHIRIIGLSATPWRLGQGMITDGGLFTDICFDITGLSAFNRLIAEGYLIPLIPKRTDTVLNTDGIHITGGDYNKKELQIAFDKKELTESALMETIELGKDRNSWLIYTTGIEHTMHAWEMLSAMGISCGYVHSGNKQFKMSDKERDESIRKFRSGEFKALINSNILTTGFDHPMVDLIAILNATQSTGKWVQTLGRGTRPVYAKGYDLDTPESRLEAIAAGPKQNCLVLDFAANTKRLGPINDPVVPRKKGSKGGTAPIKTCDNCGTYNHTSVRFCVYCGHEFVFQTKLKSSASTDELIKVELPELVEFKVDHITYSLHSKVGAPNSVKVSYFCGLRAFSEYICPEHPGSFPIRKARQWWSDRADFPFEQSCSNILSNVERLKQPTHIRVWVNKKFPEIMAYCFDGSGFGKITNIDPFDTPTIQTPELDEIVF